MKVLFLGQNPARSNPGLAFVGSRSGTTLLSWIDRAGIPIDCVKFANVVDRPTKFNRPLKKTELNSAAQSAQFLAKLADADLIFACGKQAEQAIAVACDNFSMRRINIVTIPHPSGLNRKLNDKSVVENAIAKMRTAYASTVFTKMEEF